jgi:type I restriction enzyme S subunit
MSEWKKVCLNEVTQKIGSGATPTGGKEAYKENGISLIRSQNVLDFEFSNSGLAFIDNDQAEKLNNVSVFEGDVLVNITGDSVARVCSAPAKFLPARVNQHVAILRPSKSLNSNFLKYSLLSRKRKEELLMLASSGATRNALTKSMLENFKIDLPPLPEQIAIAHILGTLDEKIELNRKMNQTLEAMAQALFKSWFVDFDPVIDNAILAGNEIPEELQARVEKRRRVIAGDVIANPDEGGMKQSPSALKPLLRTNPSLAAQFPASFVFNETLGKWIPEGWEVKSVDEAISINPSVSIKKGDVRKYVDMKALPTSGYSIDGFTFKEYSGGAKFIQGDVLLARITPCLENGKTAIVDFLNENEKGFGSTEFIVLRGKAEIKTPFVACLSRHEGFVNHCIQNMVGSSGRQRVQNSCFNSYYLVLPDSQILSKFHHETDPIFKKITTNSDELQTLTQLRDRLLPELISGRVRVKDSKSTAINFLNDR